MTNSEGDRANENEEAYTSRVRTSGNGRPRPSNPKRPTDDYQECLEEIAAIVASDDDPTVTLAQLAMVLSAAEDRGLISPGPSGE